MFLKILKYAVMLISLILGLWISALAFPQALFEKVGKYERVTIYSDNEKLENIDGIINDVNRRLADFDLPDSDNIPRIFVCQNQGLFGFYARLTLLSPNIQGFVIPLFDNVFLSVNKINELGAQSRGLPRYIKRQGSISHAITHELVHGFILDSLELNTMRGLSFWKNEGYVEYKSNIILIRSDSTASLKSRIAEFIDDRIWLGYDPHVHEAYGWELTVEYLSEVKEYGLRDIMADSVTYRDTYTDMLNWYSEVKQGGAL